MEPNKIPNVKNIQDNKTHFFICVAHSLLILLSVAAASVDEKIIEDPTYPKYKIGGWIARAGSCSIGLRPSPSVGVGKI